MDLREYWHILRRRWTIPVILTLAVAVLSGIQLRPWEASPPQYRASMRLLVGVMPLVDADIAAYDPRYYAWLTSEYLVDDFTEVVRSQLFAHNVSARVGDADPNFQLPAGVIQGSAVTGRQHRIITLDLNWGNAEQLERIAAAAATELVENAPAYFQQMGTDNADVTLLDPPTIHTVGASLRERLEWPMRMGLALIVGIGIAFLVQYMDTSVRTRKHLEVLGLSILGEIPKNR